MLGPLVGGRRFRGRARPPSTRALLAVLIDANRSWPPTADRRPGKAIRSIGRATCPGYVSQLRKGSRGSAPHFDPADELVVEPASSSRELRTASTPHEPLAPDPEGADAVGPRWLWRVRRWPTRRAAQRRPPSAHRETRSSRSKRARSAIALATIPTSSPPRSRDLRTPLREQLWRNVAALYLSRRQPKRCGRSNGCGACWATSSASNRARSSSSSKPACSGRRHWSTRRAGHLTSSQASPPAIRRDTHLLLHRSGHLDSPVGGTRRRDARSAGAP